MPSPPVTSTFDLLTLKVVSKSRVTWATPVPILVFIGLSVLDLGPMYATKRQTSDVRQRHCLMPPPRGEVIINAVNVTESDKLTVMSLNSRARSKASAIMFDDRSIAVTRAPYFCSKKVRHSSVPDLELQF